MRIISLREVKIKTSLSGSTIWRKERRGDFPAKRRLSKNRCGYLESEIDEWLSSTAVVDSSQNFNTPENKGGSR